MRLCARTTLRLRTHQVSAGRSTRRGTIPKIEVTYSTITCDSAQSSLSLQCFLLKVFLGVILGGQHSEVRTSESEDL